MRKATAGRAMADTKYQELRDIFRNSTRLFEQVRQAITVEAIIIKDEDSGTPNHANRLIWAQEALMNPESKTPCFVDVVLAKNRTASRVAIETADDSLVQQNVSEAVDLFATGSS